MIGQLLALLLRFLDCLFSIACSFIVSPQYLLRFCCWQGQFVLTQITTSNYLVFCSSVHFPSSTIHSCWVHCWLELVMTPTHSVTLPLPTDVISRNSMLLQLMKMCYACAGGCWSCCCTKIVVTTWALFTVALKSSESSAMRCMISLL